MIKIGETTVYHAGDTCLFSDMKLIAERSPIDVALLPIGGHYTMDRHDAVVAAEFVGAAHRDPDALRHLPADRDRRRRLQVRGRGEDLLAGRRCSSRARRTRSRRWRHRRLADQPVRWLGSRQASREESRWSQSRQPTGDPLADRARGLPGDLRPGPAWRPPTAPREIKLLTYAELYLLWERQQWQTQELDFSRDREDWHERIDDEERFQRMYGLSSFFIGEQKVAEELGPIMRAAPTEDQKIFLCTQIADEARHVRFFERFYREVGRARVRRADARCSTRPPST